MKKPVPVVQVQVWVLPKVPTGYLCRTLVSEKENMRGALICNEPMVYLAWELQDIVAVLSSLLVRHSWRKDGANNIVT
jgi:hypothetical protein